jgi:hypothetical protein
MKRAAADAAIVAWLLLSAGAYVLRVLFPKILELL